MDVLEILVLTTELDASPLERVKCGTAYKHHETAPHYRTEFHDFMTVIGVEVQWIVMTPLGYTVMVLYSHDTVRSGK